MYPKMNNPIEALLCNTLSMNFIAKPNAGAAQQKQKIV